eukprot:4181916-Amphidinium_carterae.1
MLLLDFLQLGSMLLTRASTCAGSITALPSTASSQMVHTRTCIALHTQGSASFIFRVASLGALHMSSSHLTCSQA